ncbi:MAG: hypothetical protein SV765_08560 [Pseudomonadota bacterium]|nr:hypothetical protein [Pseudomonadota bacterium]
MKTLTTAICITTALGASLAWADNTIVKVPRENGAVHQEFKNLLNDTLSKFRSGVGRVELKGESGNNQACNANFYTSGETTFVTMSVENGDFYNEFYIDHPHQSFKKILFQNLIMSDNNVELKVVQRDGGYSIVTDGKQLKLSSKVRGNESPTCQFSLAQARLHEGETE